MQTLHKEQKTVIAVVVVATIASIGIVIGLTMYAQIVNDKVDSPKLGMPIQDNTNDEMIVASGEKPINNLMPVPGSNVPEMIVISEESSESNPMPVQGSDDSESVVTPDGKK
jgi:hypothetical protein